MEPIHFIVPAVPVPQPRQQHRLIKTKSGKQFVQNYVPERHTVHDFKATVRQMFLAAYQGPPLTGPIRLDAKFIFPRSRSAIWKTKPMPRYRHIIKPDRDNVEKSLKDALTKLAWVDDCQVCCGELEKWVACGDEQPHVEVTITPVEFEENPPQPQEADPCLLSNLVDTTCPKSSTE